MSDGERVQTLEELEAQNDDFRVRYGRLLSTWPEDADCQALVGELRVFLGVCAAHGRYMPFGTLERRSLRNMGDYWSSRLDRDGHAVDGIPGLEGYNPKAGIPLDATCPYPGLGPYDAKHSCDFFGREGLAKDYTERLEKQGIFLIIGGSGSGKSSVALAGVGPLCQARHPDWCFPPPIKPGADPLGALATSIVAGSGRDAGTLANALRDSPAAAVSILAGMLGDQPVLLVIDQFEELLTLCRDEDAQRAFAEVLLALAPPEALKNGRRFYLLFTLRSDHLGRLEDTPHLKHLHDRLIVAEAYKYLPSMQAEDILQAILKPARRVRLRFVPATVAERLAGQTASLTNGLPLLQFALLRLWSGRTQDEYGRRLDFIDEEQLAALPDVSSALGAQAERIYKTLKLRQQELCLRLIQELFFIDENFAEPLRRRRPVDDLCEAIGTANRCPPEAVREVMDIFDREGLLRVVTDEGVRQVEVAHEALLRHWDTVRMIVSGENAKARLHRMKGVTKEAADWINHQCHTDWLKQRGEPLQRLEADVGACWVTDAEALDYVRACRAFEDGAKRRDAEQKEAEQKERDAILAKERAERERAESEREKAEALRASEEAARKVAEHQAKLEQVKSQEQQRAQARSRWYVGLGVLAVALTIGGVIYADQLRDLKTTNLGAVASLSDRLPPWEGLDLTRTLAGKDPLFRGALGHALERMDGARIVGDREKSGLALLGDGKGLMEITKDSQSKTDTVYLYRLDETNRGAEGGLRQEMGIKIQLPGQLQRSNLGAPITRSVHKGKQLFVAIVQQEDGSSSLNVWLIDFRKPDSTASIAVSGVEPDYRYYPSPIAMHPDGLELSWGFADKRREKGRLITLRLEAQVKQSSPGKNQLNGGTAVVDSLTYVQSGSAQYALAVASSNGSAEKELTCLSAAKDRPSKLGYVPAVAIASAPESGEFVLGFADGRIELATCDDGLVRPKADTPKFVGNPDSVRLIKTNTPEDGLLMSYQAKGGGVRCHFVSRRNGSPAFEELPCNTNHPVASVVWWGDMSQVVIEYGGVPVVRRYPAEFALEKFRSSSLFAGWQGSTVLCGDETAEETQVGNLLKRCVDAEQSSPIAAAVLSPSGTYKAVMRRGENGMRLDVGPVAGEAAHVDVKSYYGSGEFALAVDDAGRLAYFRRADSDPKTRVELIVAAFWSKEPLPVVLDITGQPTCVRFSPGGAYLVVGTDTGSVYRYRLEDRRPEAQSNIEVGGASAVTSCAVADDGAAAFGRADGNVLYVANGMSLPKELTEKVVYRLPGAVRAVRIDDVHDKDGGKRRVTALGAWQPNNCIHPALPGQSLRVWELGDATDYLPVSLACFPNQSVLALGGWTKKVEGSAPVAPAELQIGQAGMGRMDSGVGIRLLTPHGMDWHPCPACRQDKAETDSAIQKRLIDLAQRKGGGPSLNEVLLERRYGLKL